MAWIDVIPEEDVKFYSVADDVAEIHQTFFEFWTSLSPAVVIMFFVVFITAIVVGIVYSVYMYIKSEAIR